MFAIAGGKEVPMVQAGCNGSHLGLLQFELEGSAIRLLKDSLVCVCVPNPEIRELVDSIGRAEQFNEVYVRVTEDLIHDRNVNLHEFTEVGALVTASYLKAWNDYSRRNVRITRSAVPADSGTPVLAVHHFKGIRTGLSEGDLTRAQVGYVLPFGGDNYDEELFNRPVTGFNGKVTTTAFVNYMQQLGTITEGSYQKAAVIYKDPGKTEVGSKIEDWKTGGSISGEATMQ